MLVPCGAGADVPPNMEQNRCKEETGPMNKASLCEAIQGDLHIDSPFNALLSCIRITYTLRSGINYCMLKIKKNAYHTKQNISQICQLLANTGNSEE